MRVVEHFLSLQGEGLKIGRLTYFVRTAGCNLRCSWCDTAFSQAYDQGEEMSIPDILTLIGELENVCLTGGEPLEQADAPELLSELAKAGKTVVLETNGSKDLSAVPKSGNIIISMDIKCPSSGMHERMDFSNIALLKEKDQLKFVISDGADLEYAVEVLEKYSPACEVIFTPVGGMDIEPLAEEVVERRIRARVLPQLHKIIWGNKRAV